MRQGEITKERVFNGLESLTTATTLDVARAIGVSKSTAKRYLLQLQREGRVRERGADYGIYIWQIRRR